MDEIREDKLMHYRRVENMVRNIEENEAKTAEALRRTLESTKTSIGPANDLLRFLYILEQQYQSDSIEVRTKTRENLLEYMDSFRQSDDDAVEEGEEDDDDSDQHTDESQPPTPGVLPNPQPLPVVPAPHQPLSVAPSPPQPPPVLPSPPQPPPVLPSPPQPPLVVTSSLPSDKSQLSSLAPVTEPDYIRPATLARYEKLLSDAEQYEKRYQTITGPRITQLTSCIKNTLNRLRKETFDILIKELLDFLNGQEQKVGIQNIRISSDDERLLCLSLLASDILRQLLGADLTEIKAEIFLPLVGLFSAHERHQEFRIIFLDRLHKKCPYTVPFYPKRQPTMTDKQYFEAMGYIEKTEGDQRRLETETEFLNRMSGFIRLFCKLLVRRGPPFDQNLEYAWKWFADMLNLPPRANITALLIRVFLDEAGESMIKEYANQFRKVIETVEKKYLPKLEKESSPDQMARLRLTLNTLTNQV